MKHKGEMMTAQELDQHLQVIKDYQAKCEEANTALQKFASGSFICIDIGSDILIAYINSLSRELDDYTKDNWLSWFIWENDFGAREYEAFVGDKEFIIRNTTDLLAVIEAWKEEQKEPTK